MSEYIIRCQHCQTNHWSNETCPDIYLCCIPDWDGDEIWDNETWQSVRARSEQDAAEKYAEQHDGEGNFLDDSYEVLVKHNNQIHSFQVSAEHDITYSATSENQASIEDFVFNCYCSFCKKRHKFKNGKPIIDCKERKTHE